MRAFLLLVCTLAAAASYSVKPGSVMRGKSYVILVQENDCKAGAGSLRGATLQVVENAGVRLAGQMSDNNGCFLVATLSVDPGAAVDAVNLVIAGPGPDGAKDAALGVVTLSVALPPPGPIPPSLDPNVDISWKVLPRRTTADSFGGKVALRYFAIEVVIGNNSGYDLQVSSVSFQTPADDGARRHQAPLPSDAYNVVRSTVEKEQQTGRRAVLVNTIRGLGPMLTAGAGFFADLAAQGTYSKAVSLFTSPLEKGLELVYPDRTVGQLASLDSRTLRDNLIIPNNLSQRLLVFLSREMVECRGRRHGARLARVKDFSPEEVMNALGDLVLTGKTIDYLNRVRVVSKPEK